MPLPMTRSGLAAMGRDAEIQARKRRFRLVAGGIAAVLAVSGLTAWLLNRSTCDGDIVDSDARLCYDRPADWKRQEFEAGVLIVPNPELVTEWAAMVASTGPFDAETDGDEALLDEATARMTAIGEVGVRREWKNDTWADFAGSGVPTIVSVEAVTVDGHRAATVTADLTEGRRALVTVVELEPGRVTVLSSLSTGDADAVAAVDWICATLEVYE